MYIHKDGARNLFGLSCIVRIFKYQNGVHIVLVLIKKFVSQIETSLEFTF